jgi:hypothetical protein
MLFLIMGIYCYTISYDGYLLLYYFFMMGIYCFAISFRREAG